MMRDPIIGEAERLAREAVDRDDYRLVESPVLVVLLAEYYRLRARVAELESTGLLIDVGGDLHESVHRRMEGGAMVVSVGPPTGRVTRY